MATYWIMKTREDAVLAVLNDWVVLGAGTFFGIPYWWLSGLCSSLLAYWQVEAVVAP
jgi:hypothetical protein